MTPLFSSLLGVCVCSFLNVCLLRWKHRQQIFTPSSFCPQCKKFIRWYDNIPIVSFFLLNGRCRFCNKSISWQYPIVEGITSVLFLVSYWRFSKSLSLLTVSFFFVSFLILLV